MGLQPTALLELSLETAGIAVETYQKTMCFRVVRKLIHDPLQFSNSVRRVSCTKVETSERHSTPAKVVLLPNW